VVGTDLLSRDFGMVLRPGSSLIVHVLGGWEQFPFYNNARSANWYDLGFVLGAGSPIVGSLRGGRTRRGD
jgi:hypothetical protein